MTSALRTGNDESARLAALRRYAILDTPSEATFDRLTLFAAEVFGAPISLLTFVDEKRQWFKARLGLSLEQTSRDIAFCAYTVMQNDVFVVLDAAKDRRFADNDLVTGPPHIRFYAGAPLRTSQDVRLARCVSSIQGRVPSSAMSTGRVSRHSPASLWMSWICAWHAAAPCWRLRSGMSFAIPLPR